MQRAIESLGIPTVSITAALDITERLRPPRSVFVPFMMGHHFGVPHHAQLGRDIIRCALDRVQQVTESGEIYRFPKTWAQARNEAKALHRSE